MKLTKLDIENFRSIERLSIELNPLCTLIGCNNAGKSNILDAIALLVGERWPLTRNPPAPKEALPHPRPAAREAARHTPARR
jgi:AAA15 family ATPase/GTPase